MTISKTALGVCAAAFAILPGQVLASSPSNVHKIASINIEGPPAQTQEYIVVLGSMGNPEGCDLSGVAFFQPSDSMAEFKLSTMMTALAAQLNVSYQLDGCEATPYGGTMSRIVRVSIEAD